MMKRIERRVNKKNFAHRETFSAQRRILYHNDLKRRLKMTYQFQIKNPNGSTSTIRATRVLSAVQKKFTWDWEEVAPAVLSDDDLERVELAIMETLGDADDLSDETTGARFKYWLPGGKPLNSVDFINSTVDSYFR